MTLLIGERYRAQIAQSLAAQGIEVLWLPDNPDVDPRLAGHADLSVFASGRHVIAEKGIYFYIVRFLTNRGYIVLRAGRQCAAYPDDAGLCVCDTGKYVLYNPRTADPAAVALSCGMPVAVAQGYTRCAVNIVNDHSIITADAGVSRTAKKAGMDVLQITPGYIRLDGFDYGFIGGASFKISDTVMAFTGMLDRHPDKDRIMAFLTGHGLRAVFLTDGPIFDIGGAVALP